MMDKHPRIDPVDMADPPDGSRALLAELARERGVIPAVYRTLARSEATFPAVLGLARSLWHESTVDRRLQELVILRVAVLKGSHYEWGRHCRVAREVGVPEGTIAAVADWADSDLFRATERRCLALVDALVRDTDAGSELESVAAGLGDVAALELVLLAGFYVMMAGFLRSADVQMEPGDESLPQSVVPNNGT